MGRKHNLGRYLLGSSVIALVAASGSSARAASNEQLEEQLRIMQAQIQQLQRQIEENKAAAIPRRRAAAARSEAAQSAAAESAAAAQAAASKGGGEKEKDDLDLKVKWKGAPELSSKDGKFRMKVRGALNSTTTQSTKIKPITGQPDVSAAEIRRARLGVEGTLWKDIDYKFEVDFANDKTAIKDAYFEYTCWGAELSLPRSATSRRSTRSNISPAPLHRPSWSGQLCGGRFGLDRQIGAGAIYHTGAFHPDGRHVRPASV